MIDNIKQSTTLNNGVKMPWFGLGVWKSKSGEETENAVKWALEAGYIHVDTAALYNNEESVGKAIRESLRSTNKCNLWIAKCQKTTHISVLIKGIKLKHY